MVQSRAATVADYLAELADDRRAVVAHVRELVNRHLPPGYVEGMGWGMIGWVVPLSRYPHTYNKQPLCYLALAAQKNYYALYLNGVYGDSAHERSLRAGYAARGLKLDLGKCCLRFRRLDQLADDLIAPIVAGTTVEQFIAQHEAARAGGRCA